MIPRKLMVSAQEKRRFEQKRKTENMSPHKIIKRLCQSSGAFRRFIYSEPTGSLTPQEEEIDSPVKIEASTFNETGWFLRSITDNGREANLRSMEDFLLRSGAVVVKFIPVTSIPV